MVQYAATWYSIKFDKRNFYLTYAKVLVNNKEDYGSGSSVLNELSRFQFSYTTINMSLSNILA